MTDFARGQKGRLADMGCQGAFPIVLKLAAQGMDVDIACFGLDANAQLSDDRYMVFFNQKSSPGGGVVLAIGDGQSTFTIDVSRLPDSIHKLVFAASIGGEGTMCKLGTSSMRLGSTTFSFSGADFQDEKAVIVGEVYKRDGQWRFGAVGQGSVSYTHLDVYKRQDARFMAACDYAIIPRGSQLAALMVAAS